MITNPLAPHAFILWGSAVVFVGRIVFVAVEHLANKLGETYK